MTSISRTPPEGVRRQLRQEVGFGCPVGGCANPYLEYHHFDPPWAVRQHHDPAGMIALCATHHAKADAWSTQRCRDLKTKAPHQEIAGRFEWMRQDVLAIVGGSYFYETPIMVALGGEPVIWFTRDSDRRLLLNFNMLTTTGHPRTQLVDNDWVIRGGPTDVISPPNGSRLHVRYANGDDAFIRFREWQDLPALLATHPLAAALQGTLEFPLITAELRMEVANSGLSFGADTIHLPGNNRLSGMVLSRCGVGLSLN